MTTDTRRAERLIGERAATAAAVTLAVAGAVVAVAFAVTQWAAIQRLDFRYVQNIGAGLGHANNILLAAIGLLAAILFGVIATRRHFLLAVQSVVAAAAAVAVEWLVFSDLMDVWGWMLATRSTDRTHDLFLSNSSVLPEAAHPWWLALVGVLFASVFGIVLLRTRVLRWR